MKQCHWSWGRYLPISLGSWTINLSNLSISRYLNFKILIWKKIASYDHHKYEKTIWYPQKLLARLNNVLWYGKTVSLHFLLRRGKPVEIKSRTSQISPSFVDSLPDEVEAKIQYQRYYTGTLTDEHSMTIWKIEEINHFFNNTISKDCFKIAHIIEHSLSKRL